MRHFTKLLSKGYAYNRTPYGLPFATSDPTVNTVRTKNAHHNMPVGIAFVLCGKWANRDGEAAANHGYEEAGIRGERKIERESEREREREREMTRETVGKVEQSEEKSG